MHIIHLTFTMDEDLITDLDEKYSKRIQLLEKENIQLLEVVQELHNENNFLRKKYEETASGDIITEPYDVVNAERIALREKEVKYKKRISELEKERLKLFSALQEQYINHPDSSVIEDVISVKRRKIVNTGTDTVKTAKQETSLLNEKIAILEKERRYLEEKVRKFETKVKQHCLLTDRWKSYLKSIGINPTEDMLKVSERRDPVIHVRASRYSNQLPDIKTASSTPSLFFPATYSSIFKRRLSRMRTKNSFSRESGPWN